MFIMQSTYIKADLKTNYCLISKYFKFEAIQEAFLCHRSLVFNLFFQTRFLTAPHNAAATCLANYGSTFAPIITWRSQGIIKDG